ncbi:hypothetical protein [Nocardia sp. CA-119907]|uniref:hypothetical protein n=1 Tax=Nocardia sp. CA-119907 TaxID=3239973 RepID=UPI003D9705CB
MSCLAVALMVASMVALYTALPSIAVDIGASHVSESYAAALELAGRSGPVAEPFRQFAEAAFVHGISQAAFVLGCVVLVGAVPIAIWSPGRNRR